MRRLIVILLLAVSHQMVGQDTINHYAFGTTGSDVAVDMYRIESGYLMFGSTGTVGNGQSDIYVVQLNRSFSPLNYATIGTEGIEFLGAVAGHDSSDHFFLVSTYYDGFTSEDYDLRLDALDTSLSVSNTLHLTRPGYQSAIDAVVHGDSIYCLYLDGDNSYRILHFNNELDVLADHMVYEGDSVEGVEISVLNNQLFVLGNVYTTSNNSYDIRLIRYELDLEEIQDVKFGYFGEEFPYGITQTSDSTIIITGSSNAMYYEELDLYVGEFDTALNLIWDTIYGYTTLVENRDEIGLSSIVVGDSLYISMTTNTFGQGGADFSMYRLDRTGEFRQSATYGQSSDEVLKRMFIGHDSLFVLFGSTNSIGSGQEDFLVVTFDRVKSSENKFYYTLTDTVSQPPANVSASKYQLEDDQVEISVKHNQLVLKGIRSFGYHLYGIDGRLISSGTVDGARTFNLPSGVYVVKTARENQSVLFGRKVVVP